MTAKISRQQLGWLLLVLVLLGLNLRPLITSIGPLLPELQRVTGMNYRVGALLTSLPVLMFGVLALLGGRLVQRLGYQHGIGLGLLCIGSAALLRWPQPQTELLLFSAWLGGVGIALLQVIIPAVTKHQFPQRLAMITGLWSAALMGGAALGAVVSAPLANAVAAWHTSLAVWVWLALLGALCWYLPQSRPLTQVSHHQPAQQAVPLVLHRQPRAWLLGLYFALINGGYAGIISWLSPFYQSLGVSASASGNLLAGFCLAQVVGALVLPAVARTDDRRRLLVLASLCQAVGFAGLMLAPQFAPWLWVSLCGFGLGGAFPLAIVGALDHIKHHVLAGRLVAFMQGIGFIAASSIPFISGYLLDMTASYRANWLIHVGLALALLWLTRLFDPTSYAQAFKVPVSRPQKR